MKKFYLLMLALLSVSVFAKAETTLPKELQQYKLDNGLTVILWEDHDQPDVEGYVVTRAGAIDEPREYTGLAHYLEHMLFKGTQKIGAIDWEKEKPLYDSIVILYDQYAEATDPAVREQLATRINEKSMEASQYSTTEDFFNLLDGIGAEGVNAYTSYDVTCYHNTFPAYQMEKWLTIFSERLINPVFRTFQAELENVFEEYNMYSNNPNTQVQNTLFEQLYKGHPYELSVIGKPEHLKNPRLSKLIEFYNTWYVPSNMALIIVGNFDAEATKPLIQKTFSRLVDHAIPERKTYEEVSFAGNPTYNYKMGYYPMVVWGYKGVKVTDEDATPLQFVVSLLNNGMQTGLLDKLMLDGKISMAVAGLDARRDQGRIIVEAIPYYDISQRQYESNAATKKMVMAEIDKIKRGEIPDWLIASVKKEYEQSYKTAFESGSNKMGLLVNCFTYGLPLTDIFEENDKIQALTKEQIAATAKKYFDADYITIGFEEGKVKANPLPKPKIKPLDPIKGAVTEYSKYFKSLPEGEIIPTYNNFADVTVSTIQPNVKLHYTPNTKNDIFSLELVYGIGTEKMPMLEYAVQLMNTAGTMAGNLDAQAFRRRLAELGARVAYGVSENYFTVSIVGEDENLAEITRLVNTQLLMPKLDQEQLDNIKGSEFNSRYTMPKRESAQASALIQYAIYGKNSPYIDVVPFGDVYSISLPKVQTIIGDARTYALDAYYCGTKTAEEVVKALPLTEGMQASESPIVRDREVYNENTILFLPNSNVQQASLYFYINGKPYSLDDDVQRDAFDQYFSGGFSGLVLNEIRTKRSMAYSAYGYNATPARTGKDCYFLGYVGTQSDKVVDAVGVYLDLLTNMPKDSANLESIKAALKAAAQSAKPSMRGKGRVFNSWQRIGYTDDPARLHAQELENLSFNDIEKFYEANIKGQPITIVLMGDPKKIDLKALQAKLGCKVTKVSPQKLFAPLDLDF